MVNRGKTKRSVYARTVIAVFALIWAGGVEAQTVDYDLNMATRSIAEVETGLERLREGDVSNFNRLSSKLTKAGKHLESTQSKSHPDFEASIKRWGELQSKMAGIAAEWQKAAQAAQQKEQASAPTAAPASEAGPAAAPAPAPAPGKPEPQAREPAAPPVDPVDLDQLMPKYQRTNLPKLAEDATAAQARDWAEQMKALQTTTLDADLKTIEAALESGAASKSDADRVRMWITDSFQRTIKENVDKVAQAQKGSIRSLVYMADLINAVEDGDKNGAYRFAGNEKLNHNRTRLDHALRAGEIAAVLDDVFGTTDPARGGELEKLRAARARLDELAPLAAEQAEAFATMPKKERKKNPEFLAPIAQKYWLNGSIMAESDAEGGIWIEGNNVGDITHNGEIWVEANHRGSLEPDGTVWFGGNEVGSLEDNGEVWRDGNQVGLIDDNGKAWVGGSAAGEIEPFQGEWKRAAILYYFRDHFR